MALRVGGVGPVRESSRTGWDYLAAFGRPDGPVWTWGRSRLATLGSPMRSGAQLTTNLELVRTRGIRLFN